MLVHARDGNGPTPSPTAGPSASDARDQRANALFSGLTRAFDGRAGGVAGLAAPGSVDRLRTIESNIRRIGVTDVRLQYTGPRANAESVTGANPGKVETWTAQVRLSWRIAPYEHVVSNQDVGIVIVDDGTDARFGEIVAGAEGERVPLWLLQPLVVRKSERVLVLAPSQTTAVALLRLAETAVATVGRVLPHWRGALVVQEPSSQNLLDQVVGAGPETTTLLAALTTTADGSSKAPERILLNPEVFDELGPNAQQIVVSHEATHVATAGATSTMPQWLIEGFADYVALRDLEIPVQTSASQILAVVRRDGVPSQLPTDADFTGENSEIGADYEAAWLAASLIADRYGEQKLVAFYRATDRSDDIRRSFRTVLGTTQREFTRAWSAYTESLASGG